MRSSTPGRAWSALAAAALLTGLTACGAANEAVGSQNREDGLSGTLAGAGASSQDAAQQAWRAAFVREHPGVTINYSPIGSGGGRERFISGATDFGGTDAPLSQQELAAAKKRCGKVIEAPVYISPIAVGFNLSTPRGKPIKHLNLSPQTVAKIFNGTISRWNAPAIAADNPDVELPDTKITPVHRSDESGTTENFTDYLAVAAPQQWKHEASGNWPISGGEAAKGTAGVKRAINAGPGTIGYLDASQAKGMGTAAVEVGDEFVEYSPEAAAKVLEVSDRITGQGEYVFTYDLARDTTESGAYPIVLVSYGLACTRYDDAGKAELVRSYLSYVVSEQGQQAAAEAAGSAPLSPQLRKKITPAIESISATSGS